MESPRDTRLSLAYLRTGASLPGDCGSSPLTRPAWLDMERFERGKDFFMRHVFSMILAMHLSLTTGLSIINLLEPLVFTNMSHTPRRAFSRYVQTFLHLMAWHTGDVWSPEHPAHESVQSVRRMHNHVARRMSEEDNGRTFLSQYDMALVQSGFMGAITMYPEQFGVKCTRCELEDYIHFWRGVGYLLGIDDRYNMCSGDYQETYDVCKEIEQSLLAPALMDPPKDFQRMVEAYVAGSNIPNGFQMQTPQSLIAVSMEGMGLRSAPLSLLDTLRYWLLKTTMLLVRWCPGFETFMNNSLMRRYGLFKKRFNARSMKFSFQ